VGYIRTVTYVRAAGAGGLGAAGRPALGFESAVPVYSAPAAGAYGGGVARFGAARAQAAANARAGAAHPSASVAGRKWHDYLALSAAAGAPRASGAGSAERLVHDHETWLRHFAAAGGAGSTAAPPVVAAGLSGYEVGASAAGAPGSKEAIAGADFVIYITANKNKPQAQAAA
jgi:hypothetical protein